jgi:hypothetical protein
MNAETGFAEDTLKRISVPHEWHYFDALNLRQFLANVQTYIPDVTFVYEDRAARSKRLRASRRQN